MPKWDTDKELAALHVMKRDGLISSEQYYRDMIAVLEEIQKRKGGKVAMCLCVDVQVGSYDNQVTVQVADSVDLRYNAPGRELRETVALDVCIADEIMALWTKGIVTTGCCCGHNRTIGYIGVTDEYIPQMKAMGYKVILNPQYPDAEDSFVPKYEEGT